MQNQPIKTTEIFHLACRETKTGMEGYGLTASGVDLLAGCISQHSKTEDEFVREANNFAENFSEIVEDAIERINEDENSSAATSIANIKVMSAMLGWKYDVNELEKLAREDWQEHHVTELLG